MNGDIEELVLSGKLFNPPSRSSSPVRSRSPSPAPAKWPGEDSDYEYDSDIERRKTIEKAVGGDTGQESIGVGVTGRTGVKGVIRDSKEAAANARAKRNEEIRALNRAMEKASLGGKTWAEEEGERLAQKALEEGRSDAVSQAPRKGRFGHLREVGVRGYVQAVEGEERNTWVVVHIYDPSLDRCAQLDDTLSRLARLYPSVKFLRARAGALGFATSTTSAANGHSQRLSRQPFTLTRTPSRKILVPGRFPDDDDDDFDDDDSESDKDEGWEDDAVDTDVLPTLLVYQGGELVHSWVRVDWEAQMGVEELLRRHHILSDFSSGARDGNYELSDDEDFDDGDLVFGGSDDGL